MKKSNIIILIKEILKPLPPPAPPLAPPTPIPQIPKPESMAVSNNKLIYPAPVH